MPTKMATCCREKAVLVTVYIERPRRRKVSSRQPHHHHHHHHHHHLHLHQPIIRQKGYNRKADLLHYSQRLRESARTTASTPSHPNPVFSNKQKPATQIVPIQRKPKYARTPTCLGNWRVLIPNFLRSMTSLQAKKEWRKKKKNNGSTSKKIGAVVKRLEVQKKWASVSKMFATIRKHRYKPRSD